MTLDNDPQRPERIWVEQDKPISFGRSILLALTIMAIAAGAAVYFVPEIRFALKSVSIYLPKFASDFQDKFIAGTNTRVDVCNSVRVLSVIKAGSLDKTKTEAIAFFNSFPGGNTPNIVSKIENMTATIINIRQSKFDQINNIRYCIADFEYQHPMGAGIWFGLVGSGVVDSTCAKSFSYKIERTLDTPDSAYVTWRCL